VLTSKQLLAGAVFYYRLAKQFQRRGAALEALYKEQIKKELGLFILAGDNC
jgi:hypothetical protein